jgi:hypothetical protein
MIATLLCLAALAADTIPTPAANDDTIAKVARDNVVVTLYAPLTAPTARAVIQNRTDEGVRVEFTVERAVLDPVQYAQEVGPKETVGTDGSIVVATGKQLSPALTITRVAHLPISEASGYVLVGSDHDHAVTVDVFRAPNRSDRVYVVITNNNEREVQVRCDIAGLRDNGESFTVNAHVLAKAIDGRDGTRSLTWEPPTDPRVRRPIRVQITNVTP